MISVYGVAGQESSDYWQISFCFITNIVSKLLQILSDLFRSGFLQGISVCLAVFIEMILKPVVVTQSITEYVRYDNMSRGFCRF